MERRSGRRTLVGRKLPDGHWLSDQRSVSRAVDRAVVVPIVNDDLLAVGREDVAVSAAIAVDERLADVHEPTAAVSVRWSDHDLPRKAVIGQDLLALEQDERAVRGELALDVGIGVPEADLTILAGREVEHMRPAVRSAVGRRWARSSST